MKDLLGDKERLGWGQPDSLSVLRQTKYEHADEYELSAIRE